MRGTIILATLCLMGLCIAPAAGADQLDLNLVEWNIPGVPDSPAVVYRLDGRDIKARAGERVYISSGRGRGMAVTGVAVAGGAGLSSRSGGMETLAVAPPAAAAPASGAQPGQTYPRTRVTLPGYTPQGNTRSSAPRPAPAPAVESARAYAAIGGGATLPRAFTFEPDYSPVILTGVTSPGGRMPVRNANVYRRYGGGRAAAEVIETVPPDPRSDADNSGMVPPGGGGLPRAEVVLPSSTRGIGLGTEYGTGR